MEDRRGSRPRARSEAVPPRRDDYLSPVGTDGRRQPHVPGEGDEGSSRSPGALPRRAATFANQVGEHRSPQRAVASSTQFQASDHGSGIQRRSTALSRQSASRSTGNRSRGPHTMGQAGPDDTPQLRAAHENYIHPGYTELNPSYEQPASVKPIWSLAKPLPRVIRPGMVPTREEVLEAQQQPERPSENVQKAGVDVDPTDLELGRVQPTINQAKLSAQLKDSRIQRENNFVANIQRRGTATSWLDTRLTRASSQASQTGWRARAESTASRQPMSPSREEEVAASPAPIAPTGLDSTQDQQEVPPASPSEQQATRLSQQRSGGEGQPLEPIPEYNEPTHPRISEENDSSAETVRAEEELDFFPELQSLKLEQENPPLWDEIHNNHTSWSVYRTQHREFLAELLGVFVQETIGFCADTSATLNGNYANVNTTAWAWGFASMTGIYLSGGISGAHLNPTITIMLWFYRGFPKRKMIPYFAAQFLGAFLAGFAAYGAYYSTIQHYESLNPGTTDILNGFVTGPRFTYIDKPTAFFNEFLSTAFLSCAVLALGDDQNAPPGAGMNAMIIGLLITVLNFAFAYETGAAMNPSRDFGPRLAMLALGYGKELFTDPFWFYGPWAGTLCGAFVGAGMYDVCIFTGGESPINYPWTRTKRSFVKGKAKWKRRLLPGGAARLKEKDLERDLR